MDTKDNFENHFLCPFFEFFGKFFEQEIVVSNTVNGIDLCIRLNEITFTEKQNDKFDKWVITKKKERKNTMSINKQQ